MKKFLYELSMLLIGLIGIIAFIATILFFVFYVPFGERIFTFLAWFALFRVIAELIIRWLEEKKKSR